MKWFYCSFFATNNDGKPYNDRVRPFNFLLCMQSETHFKTIKPVAPFSKDLNQAVKSCFDRNTGHKVNKAQLKTYVDAVAQYHLHPETKFLNGDYMDFGVTQRRHINVTSIHNIGKEANKWEEQFFTGFDKDAQIEYGISEKQKIEMLETVLQAIKIYGVKPMADISKLSQRHVLNMFKGKTNLSENTLLKLYSASKTLENTNNKENELRELIRNTIKEKGVSIRKIARMAEIDPSNLFKLLSGKRNNFQKLDFLYELLNK